MPKNYRNNTSHGFIQQFLQFLYAIIVFLLLLPQKIFSYCSNKLTNSVPQPSVDDLVAFIESDGNKKLKKKNSNRNKPKQIEVKEKPKVLLEFPQTQTVDSTPLNESITVPKISDKNKGNMPSKEKTKKPHKKSIRNMKHVFSPSHLREIDESSLVFEISLDNPIKSKTQRQKIYYSQIIPADIIKNSMAPYFDYNTTLSMRGVSTCYFRFFDIDTSIINKNKYQFIFDIISLPEHKSFLNTYNELNFFSKPQKIPNNFRFVLQQSFKILLNKYHVTNKIEHNEQNKTERRLLALYTEFSNENNEIDISKVFNFMKDFQHWLCLEKHLQYEVFFHVEKSNSLASVIEEWNAIASNGNKCFEVSPHETFFYPIEDIGLPVLSPNTVISILVIPCEKFDDNKNYLSRTDFQRRYKYIGDCIYFLDPACRFVTIQLGEQKPKYIINDNRYTQLDLVITNNPRISLNEVLDEYVNDLRSRAHVKSSGNSPYAR